MPILDLQRSLRQIGRIRLGQQVPTSSGKTRPAKLTSFRFTSADEVAIKSAAALFGGEPRRWEGAPVGDQWEVITDASAIAVIVPPTSAAYSAWYEQWSGGGCLRRCDGETEMLSDQPCLCANEDERVCTPHTRLNVILADLPGLGVWRLDTQGWYAARELAGVVEVITGAATHGQLLPAVLRLEQRQTKRIVDGKSQTRNFAVPVLDITMTPTALGLVVGQSAPEALPAGESWQPIPPPPVELAPVEDVSGAIRHAGNPGPRRTKRSAPELPPTGVNPRKGLDAQFAKLHALYDSVGIKDAATQKQTATALLGLAAPLETHKTLPQSELSKLIDVLTDVEAGRVEFVLDDDANVTGLRDAQPQEAS